MITARTRRWPMNTAMWVSSKWTRALLARPGLADADAVAVDGHDAVAGHQHRAVLGGAGQGDAEVDRRRRGGPALCGCPPADASVGPLVVVVGHERVELGLQLGQAGSQGPTAQPLLQRLLEALHLA